MNNAVTEDSLDVLIEKVEKDLLDIIVKELENSKLEPEKAQQLAKDFLALLPINHKVELLQKLHKLSGTYPQAQSVFVKYAVPFEEEETHRKLASMANLI